jgi:hypothetical protein
MSGAYVPHSDEATRAHQTTTTTADGRFVFYNVRPAAYTVSVQVLDAPAGAPPLLAEHVWPDGGELSLAASFPEPVDELPGEVRLRFHDAAGRLAHPDALSLTLHPDASWFRTRFERDGDEYVFDELPPGRYRLNVLSGEDVIHSGDWFSVQSGEVRDLGLVETEPGSALEIHVARPKGTESLEPRVFVSHRSSPHGHWLEFGRGSRLLVENMNPGTWALSMYGEGLVSTWSEVEVRAEETASARLELRAAVERVFEIAYPDEVILKELHLAVHDEAGRELWEWADPQPNDHGRPYRRRLNLPLGLIRVAVKSDGGLTGALEFTMSSLEPDQPPVRIELR